MKTSIKKQHSPSPAPLPLPQALKVLVLAPHPDDFDSTCVTLHEFKKNGAAIDLFVLLSGASGVEDSFCSPPTVENKTALRVEEQKQSCAFWGLPEDKITFFSIQETGAGDPDPAQDTLERIIQSAADLAPELVILPHGNDTNNGHRWTYSVFQTIARTAASPPAALLFRDPKTVSMREDVLTFFGEEQAQWKATMLRFHRSQHQRNLNTRNHGFDERILMVNRDNAAAYPGEGPYAEVFELEAAGPDKNSSRFYCSFSS